MQSVCRNTCSCGTCLHCVSRSNNFPSVSWYQDSEHRKSHGTLFLLPYGNKCHVFFLVSLIPLLAIQFSKYLPLSAESLLYGQVFAGTCSSVLSTANPCACRGALRQGVGSRAWQQGRRGRDLSLPQQPVWAWTLDPQTSPQWWGRAGTSHRPWAPAARPPGVGLLSAPWCQVRRVTHMEAFAGSGLWNNRIK